MEKKVFYTESDGGTIMVGTKEFKAHYGNAIGGDGTNTVWVIEEGSAPKEAKFIDSVEGEFDLYDYDCPSFAEPIYHMKGRYGYYIISDEVCIFERWGD